MIVTNVGRGCGGRGSCRLTSAAESVRQRRVVLTSRCWRQCTWRQQLSGRDGGKRAVLRGEHVISRKAIAQGMSDVLRCPVCSCAHFSVHIAHETAGAARIRHSLRPLTMRARSFQQTSGAMRRENATLCLERRVMRLIEFLPIARLEKLLRDPRSFRPFTPADHPRDRHGNPGCRAVLDFTGRGIGKDDTAAGRISGYA